MTARPIVPGDTVRVRPTHGRSFAAVVRNVVEHDDGTVEITVVGGANGRSGWRTVTRDRVTRMRKPQTVRA